MAAKRKREFSVTVTVKVNIFFKLISVNIQSSYTVPLTFANHCERPTFVRRLFFHSDEDMGFELLRHNSKIKRNKQWVQAQTAVMWIKFFTYLAAFNADVVFQSGQPAYNDEPLGKHFVPSSSAHSQCHKVSLAVRSEVSRVAICDVDLPVVTSSSGLHATTHPCI